MGILFSVDAKRVSRPLLKMELSSLFFNLSVLLTIQHAFHHNKSPVTNVNRRQDCVSDALTDQSILLPLLLVHISIVVNHLIFSPLLVTDTHFIPLVVEVYKFKMNNINFSNLAFQFN